MQTTGLQKSVSTIFSTNFLNCFLSQSPRARTPSALMYLTASPHSASGASAAADGALPLTPQRRAPRPPRPPPCRILTHLSEKPHLKISQASKPRQRAPHLRKFAIQFVAGGQPLTVSVCFNCCQVVLSCASLVQGQDGPCRAEAFS